MKKAANSPMATPTNIATVVQKSECPAPSERWPESLGPISLASPHQLFHFPMKYTKRTTIKIKIAGSLDTIVLRSISIFGIARRA
jgi:hypothetical protein